MDKTCIETETIDNILVVKFLLPALSNKVFSQLNNILDEVTDYRGVIFTSKSDKLFLAGADLYEVDKILKQKDVDLAREIIRNGQDTFTRIQNLRVPTVAAIHGACLGGGYELSLACDYRVASTSKETKIGLPEVTLGILPAWGGCTRLVPVVGLQEALTAILTGKLYAAKPALKAGLVTKTCHKENIIATAIKLINDPPAKKVPSSWMPSSIVFNVAKKTALSKTKGNYPAPLKIIDVIRQSISTTQTESLKLEEEAFLELVQTSVCRNLLDIFFMQEKSKKLLSGSQKPNKLNEAVVVGAGTMGAGIAQWLTSRGVSTLLKDVNDECINRGLKQIGKLYVQGVKKFKFDRPAARDGLAKLTTTTDDITLKNKQIVIEAIVENLNVKQKVLAQLEEKLSDDAIIATNTSALSIDEMATCLKRPERFVGIHFFNPVHQMKLVEVVKGSKTSEDTVRRAVQFVQQIGKLPVVVQDSPGFVVNRILVPYLVKAAELLKHDHQLEAVDSAMIKFGMPMGPFRLMDEIGLDVCYHVAHDLRTRLDRDYDLSELELRIEKDELGKKSGQGFYKYNKGKAVRSKIHQQDLDTVTDLLVQTMVTESLQVLEEGVIDDGSDLDFAMIMGTGWAPFRGGPIHYTSADHLVEEQCCSSVDSHQ